MLLVRDIALRPKTQAQKMHHAIYLDLPQKILGGTDLLDESFSNLKP